MIAIEQSLEQYCCYYNSIITILLRSVYSDLAHDNLLLDAID